MQGEGDGHLTGADPPLQLRQATDAADKIDAFVPSGVRDHQEEFGQIVSQEADIQPTHRIIRQHLSHRNNKLVPASAEIPPEAPGCRGFYWRFGRADLEALTHSRQESRFVQAAQIKHQPIVIQREKGSSSNISRN